MKRSAFSSTRRADRSSTKRRWPGRSNERLIAGAALDVYENEPAVHPGLLPLENVVLVAASRQRHARDADRDGRPRGQQRRSRCSPAAAADAGMSAGAAAGRSARPRFAPVMRRLARAIDGLEEPAVEKIAEDQQDDPFQVLIATMLSAQTQDAVTACGIDAAVPVARTPRDDGAG